MPPYQQCTRCIMDTHAPNIVFDKEGICNFCTKFAEKLATQKKSATDKASLKEQFLAQVKAQGRGKDYDCIVGVSGGVDSSYALYLAVKEGLRPLAVHLDNGWNSELASHNIANLISSLQVDLYTHVIDWQENRDMQRSFFKAQVVDIELLMDNAISALNYKMAARYGVQYILGGTNTSTEGMDMPKGWNHLKFDARNIRDIQKKHGTLPIKSHPLISTFSYIWYEFIRKIKWISFLDYYEYKKDEALKILEQECNYKPYPYKHYESVFTRFYQAHILPKKFNIDKRRLHLSTLVISGQMSRAEAEIDIQKPTYPNPDQERQDFQFVMKKLGFTEEEFKAYLKAPAQAHSSYKSEERLWDKLKGIYKHYLLK